MKMKRSPRGLYAPELLEARIAPATFIVTNLADDGSDGTLRKEIADANAAPGADTITFAPALFAGGVPGIVTLAGAVEIPITDTLIIKGPGVDLLTVSGGGASRIFKIDDGDNAALHPATISGLSLSSGNAADFGGAIFSRESLALKNVVLRGNYAGVNGGAVFVITAGKISVTGSSIVHNRAGQDAGGLYLKSLTGVSLVKTTISNNVASNRGGLYAGAANANAILLIDKCVIANNTATASAAGGLQLNSVGQGKILLQNTLVTGNTAAVVGGGLFVNDGKLTISKTTFSNNTAGRGGAIADDQAASVSVSGSRFLGNRADDAAGSGGGALYLEGAGIVKIAGTLFSGNSSATNGGAVSVQGGALTLSIAGSSFLHNTAKGGGAMAFGGETNLTVKGSLFSANTAEPGGGGAILAGSLTPTVLNLSGNKFTENRAASSGAIEIFGNATTANLVGNLFQANVANDGGGAVTAAGSTIFQSKADKFIGNVAVAAQGGALFLTTSGATFVTGSLFESNTSGSSGGAISVNGSATLASIKVINNISGVGGRGGGIRAAGGLVAISKSIVTGNVASDGGGIFYNVGTTTIDAATRAATRGNSAASSPNLGSA